MKDRPPSPSASRAVLFLRSLAFTLALFIITPPYSFVVLAAFALPPLKRWRLISGWARMVMWLARVLLGLRYSVRGLEHLPREPAIILAKHQSAWETIAFQCIFPPHVHVLKRSLLWIPFFGWALALMSQIAIDRGRARGALKRMAERGTKRLEQGFWILVFPEGTRTRPGLRGTYHPGGAWLAARTGVPVVPVAHNAGLYWGKNAFLKRPGEIVVVIGEPLRPSGHTAEALNQKVQTWIESRMEALCPAA
ncbi:MAG: acyl-phosphate glycerol 3-phosphate acyltransferase, partial [Betaproteobacteria bacterium RBG_16_64_9]